MKKEKFRNCTLRKETEEVRRAIKSRIEGFMAMDDPLVMSCGADVPMMVGTNVASIFTVNN